MKRVLSLILSLLLLFTCFSAFAACKKNNNSQGDGGQTDNGEINTDLTKLEGYELIEIPENYDENSSYTISQVNMTYTPSLALPLDCILAYSNYMTASSKIKGYLDKGYKQVGIMIALGRDLDGYYINGTYDGETHYDIVQASVSTEDKNSWLFHSGTTYYVCPTLGFSEYLVECCIRGIDAGATMILIEEPDFFERGGYEDAYKQEWEDYFGTPWEAYDKSDINSRFMHTELKAYIMTRAMDYITTKVKEYAPDVEIILCSHSSSNYMWHRIAANNYDILALPGVDGMVLQAWTDTTSRSFTVQNQGGRHVFEYSWMEYSEGINYARSLGKKIYALNDPLADNEDIRDIAYNYYMENIMAQTINPYINAYEVVWPDRFLWSEGWYKSMQESVYHVLNDMAKNDVYFEGGSAGVGVVTSYNVVADDYDSSHADSLITSLTCNLVASGVPVDVLTLESIQDLEYLDGIHTLILSYDFIKPTYNYDSTSPEYRKRMVANDVISEWVKQGGSLIYVGGANVSQGMTCWWNTEMDYDSPEAHLFDLLGLNLSIEDLGYQYDVTLKSEVTSNYLKDYYIDDIAEMGYRMTAYNINGGRVLYSLNGKNVISEKEVGDGHVILAGLEGSIFSAAGDDTYQLLENLVTRAMGVQGKQFCAPGYMYAKRGDWEIVKTFKNTYTLDPGLYIDIFSTRSDYIDIKIQENLTVEANSYGIYKKIEETDDPYLIHANGTTISCVTEGNTTTAEIKNLCKNSQYDATYGISLWWTAGKEPKDVYLYYNNSENTEITESTHKLNYYVDDYGILHIIYEHNTLSDLSAIIEIRW